MWLCSLILCVACLVWFIVKAAWIVWFVSWICGDLVVGFLWLFIVCLLTLVCVCEPLLLCVSIVLIICLVFIVCWLFELGQLVLYLFNSVVVLCDAFDRLFYLNCVFVMFVLLRCCVCFGVCGCGWLLLICACCFVFLLFVLGYNCCSLVMVNLILVTCLWFELIVFCFNCCWFVSLFVFNVLVSVWVVIRQDSMLCLYLVVDWLCLRFGGVAWLVYVRYVLF